MLNHIPRNLLLKHFHKLCSFRPGTDKRHIPPKDIKELRKFIYRSFSNDFPYSGNSGIPLHSPSLLFLLILLYPHGTKLEHHKWTIMKPYSFLFKNDRSRRIELNQNCHNDHQRTKKKNPDQRTQNIYHSF